MTLIFIQTLETINPEIETAKALNSMYLCIYY